MPMPRHQLADFRADAALNSHGVLSRRTNSEPHTAARFQTTAFGAAGSMLKMLTERTTFPKRFRLKANDFSRG